MSIGITAQVVGVESKQVDFEAQMSKVGALFKQVVVI